jgi:hypothetical protein
MSSCLPEDAVGTVEGSWSTSTTMEWRQVISSYDEVLCMANITWLGVPYDERANLARLQEVVIVTRKLPHCVLETCTFPPGYLYPSDHPRSSSMTHSTGFRLYVPSLVDSICISLSSCSDKDLGDFGLNSQIHGLPTVVDSLALTTSFRRLICFLSRHFCKRFLMNVPQSIWESSFRSRPSLSRLVILG